MVSLLKIFDLFFVSFVCGFVNGDNLWYYLEEKGEFSLDFCYFSGNNSQSLPHLPSTFEDTSIEAYLLSAIESVLVSSGFNGSLIDRFYFSTTYGLEDSDPYSYRCYTYGVSLGSQDDDTNYAALYYDTNGLDSITLSQTFTRLMIDASDNALNDDFRMLIYGAYMLCDVKSDGTYCDTNNNHYLSISSLTQDSQLFEQVGQGTTMFEQQDNNYQDYKDDNNIKFVLSIRLMQIAIVANGSDEQILCVNNYQKISENMQNYFASNSDYVGSTSWILCDPDYYIEYENGTNGYLVQTGIYEITWNNATKFYIDYINHDSFSSHYFGNTINSWTSNAYTTVVYGQSEPTISQEQILSVYIACKGDKTTVCDVNEYFQQDASLQLDSCLQTSIIMALLLMYCVM